jgi:hypothetical protein
MTNQNKISKKLSFYGHASGYVLSASAGNVEYFILNFGSNCKRFVDTDIVL